MISLSRPFNVEDNDTLLELEPDLPIPVFTSTEPWHPERIGALTLYCSDGRWGEAFDEFCHRCLQIPRYDRWAVPGGPAWLAAAEGDSAAHGQLDFLVRIHEVRRIVLITHYGCAAYAQRFQRSAPACLPAQVEDVRTAAQALQKRYAGIRVEGYLAMRRQRALSFHELGTWGE